MFKYLPFYQWIVTSDLDIMVANMSRSLDSFLDDSVDVILQERENRELHAGMFMIKNSDFGRRFILNWMSLSDPVGADTGNLDNSDLHLAVANYFLESNSCQQHRKDVLKEHFTFADYFAYFFCLRDKLAEFESNSDPQQCTFRYGNNIKVHRAYSGFLRSMAGMNADFTNHLELKAFITDYKGVDVRQLLVHFLPGDFAVHGKQLNEFMNEEHLHCPHPMAPLAGQASQWMSAEQAAEILGGTSPNYYHCIGS